MTVIIADQDLGTAAGLRPGPPAELESHTGLPLPPSICQMLHTGPKRHALSCSPACKHRKAVSGCQLDITCTMQHRPCLAQARQALCCHCESNVQAGSQAKTLRGTAVQQLQCCHVCARPHRQSDQQCAAKWNFRPKVAADQRRDMEASGGICTALSVSHLPHLPWTHQLVVFR